jgi:membrane protein
MAGMIAGMNFPVFRNRPLAVLRLTVVDALNTLRTWPWFDTLRTLLQRFREDRLGLSAGSLTFTTLIALVPLLTVMLALFTAFPMFAKFQDSLQKYFLQSLVPDTIARPVLGTLTQFASKASRLGGAGLAFLVISALSLMLTIDRTLNGIWRVRKARPIAQRVLVYWAAITLGPLVLGVSLSMTSWVLSANKGLVGAMPGGLKFVLDVIEFVLLASAMSALFHYVPNTHVRWRHAVAGGLFVAVGLDLAKEVLTWYLASVTTYSAIYGAFATVPIFLLWLFTTWVIVLLGAVIAAYAPALQMHVNRRSGGGGAPGSPGDRAGAGRLDGARLGGAAGRGRRPAPCVAVRPAPNPRHGLDRHPAAAPRARTGGLPAPDRCRAPDTGRRIRPRTGLSYIKPRPGCASTPRGQPPRLGTTLGACDPL